MKVRIFIVLLLIINFTYTQSVRINEVSASNTLFYDEDGDTPDWIELYNYGSS